jgi:hypothetical protein
MISFLESAKPILGNQRRKRAEQQSCSMRFPTEIHYFFRVARFLWFLRRLFLDLRDFFTLRFFPPVISSFKTCKALQVLFFGFSIQNLCISFVGYFLVVQKSINSVSSVNKHASFRTSSSTVYFRTSLFPVS